MLALFSQLIVVLLVLLIGGLLLDNLVSAMDQRGFLPDYGFLGLTAGFEIAEKIVPYDPSDTYAEALLIGLLNTLWVSIVGIFLATVLGLVIGIARLSPMLLYTKR